MSSYDYYYMTSSDTQLRRCNECWRNLAQGDGIVANNGFYPASVKYPHAKWCKHGEQTQITARGSNGE